MSCMSSAKLMKSTRSRRKRKFSRSSSENSPQSKRRRLNKEHQSRNAQRTQKKSKRSKRAAKLYCVCRQPDDGSHMVQCAYCQEWFHVRCIPYSSEQAENMYADEFRCPLRCRQAVSADHDDHPDDNHNNNNMSDHHTKQKQAKTKARKRSKSKSSSSDGHVKKENDSFRSNKNKQRKASPKAIDIDLSMEDSQSMQDDADSQEIEKVFTEAYQLVDILQKSLSPTEQNESGEQAKAAHSGNGKEEADDDVAEQEGRNMVKELRRINKDLEQQNNTLAESLREQHQQRDDGLAALREKDERIEALQTRIVQMESDKTAELDAAQQQILELQKEKNALEGLVQELRQKEVQKIQHDNNQLWTVWGRSSSVPPRIPSGSPPPTTTQMQAPTIVTVEDDSLSSNNNDDVLLNSDHNDEVEDARDAHNEEGNENGNDGEQRAVVTQVYLNQSAMSNASAVEWWQCDICGLENEPTVAMCTLCATQPTE